MDSYTDSVTRRAAAFDVAIVVLLIVATRTRAGVSNLKHNVKSDSIFGSHAAWQREINWWIAASAVMLLAVLLRRLQPTIAISLAAGGQIVHVLSRLVPFTAIDFALPLIGYTVAVSTRSKTRWLSLGLGAVGASSPWWLGRELTLAGESVRYLPMALLIIAVLIGLQTRSRAALIAAADQRAVDMARDAEQRVLLAAAEERATIGREMHDIIAHGLAIIVVQSQAALAALKPDPPRAEAALHSIVQAGRRSLAETRGLLELTRSDGTTRAPLPTAADIPDLVRSIRAAGVAVRFEPNALLETIPPAVGLSAYRIVQEALTNVLKHAGPVAQANIEIRLGDSALILDITNTTVATTQALVEGNGLRGIRDRAALHAGEVTVERSGCMFELCVTLPVDESQ
jgi:signal transduction histidine kinase